MIFEKEIWFLKQKLWYSKNAVNEYSIHSPFLFDMYLKAIKHKRKQELKKSIEDYLASNNYSYSIVPDPHKSKEHLAKWNNRIAEQKAHTYYIDLFSFAIVVESESFKIPQHFVLQ